MQKKRNAFIDKKNGGLIWIKRKQFQHQPINDSYQQGCFCHIICIFNYVCESELMRNRKKIQKMPISLKASLIRSFKTNILKQSFVFFLIEKISFRLSWNFTQQLNLSFFFVWLRKPTILNCSIYGEEKRFSILIELTNKRSEGNYGNEWI